MPVRAGRHGEFSVVYMDAELARAPWPTRAEAARFLCIAAVPLAILCAAFFALHISPAPLLVGALIVAPLTALRIRTAMRAVEIVRVTGDEISVVRRLGGKKALIWSSPLLATDILLEQPAQAPASLRLRHRDASLPLARILVPDERLAFAKALQAAVNAARVDRDAE